jgi:hypothetical protein
VRRHAHRRPSYGLGRRDASVRFICVPSNVTAEVQLNDASDRSPAGISSPSGTAAATAPPSRFVWRGERAGHRYDHKVEDCGRGANPTCAKVWFSSSNHKICSYCYRHWRHRRALATTEDHCKPPKITATSLLVGLYYPTHTLVTLTPGLAMHPSTGFATSSWHRISSNSSSSTKYSPGRWRIGGGWHKKTP